jgi:hypothetical protein
MMLCHKTMERVKINDIAETEQRERRELKCNGGKGHTGRLSFTKKETSENFLLPSSAVF